MLTIEHSKYPHSAELRSLRVQVATQDTTFPPPYIMCGMRLQYAIDQGAKMSLTENAILIKWPEGADSTGAMERLMFSENENNYLIDMVYRVLI